MLSLFKKKKKIELVNRISANGGTMYHVKVNGEILTASISWQLEKTVFYYEELIKSNGGKVHEDVVIRSCRV